MGAGAAVCGASTVVPARADQVEPQGLDELLADLGGGDHGRTVVPPSPKGTQ